MYARIDLDGGDDYSRSTMCLVRSYIQACGLLDWRIYWVSPAVGQSATGYPSRKWYDSGLVSLVVEQVVFLAYSHDQVNTPNPVDFTPSDGSSSSFRVVELPPLNNGCIW